MWSKSLLSGQKEDLERWANFYRIQLGQRQLHERSLIRDEGQVTSKFRRLWEAYDWQRFALQFAQQRHGAQNLQTVPDTVQGDAGIEFYSLDGCAYQCYAPQSASDTAKAASAMKQKAKRDLGKLKIYELQLTGILGSVRISRRIFFALFWTTSRWLPACAETGRP